MQAPAPRHGCRRSPPDCPRGESRRRPGPRACRTRRSSDTRAVRSPVRHAEGDESADRSPGVMHGQRSVCRRAVPHSVSQDMSSALRPGEQRPRAGVPPEHRRCGCVRNGGRVNAHAPSMKGRGTETVRGHHKLADQDQVAGNHCIAHGAGRNDNGPENKSSQGRSCCHCQNDAYDARNEPLTQLGPRPPVCAPPGVCRLIRLHPTPT